MSKSKKRTSTPKKKPTFLFTPATDDYLLRNNGVLTPAAIARDTGATVEEVIAQTQILIDRKSNEGKVPTRCDKFEKSINGSSGSVSMTGAQSQLDDESPKGTNKEFMEKYKNSIAKIHEDRVQG